MKNIIAIFKKVSNFFTRTDWHELTERVGLYILVAFISIGIIMLLALPFSREVSACLLVAEMFIVIFGFCPIAIYGVYTFVKEVVL